MQTLGLHIDKPFIRAALLQKGRGGIQLRSLESALFIEPAPVKRLYLSNFKGLLASGLSSKDLLIRPIELKITNMRHIEEALSFQSEGATHLPQTEILTVPHAIKKGKKKVEALLCTVMRSGLRAHLQELEKIQADPDTIGSNCLALASFIRWKAPSLIHAFAVDLGSSEWTCVWIENGELKKSRSIPLGMEGLLAALWEDRKKILLAQEVEGAAKQIDLLQLKPHLNPGLSTKLNEMKYELGKTILSFFRAAGAQRPLIFTGSTEAFGHLREFLTERLEDAIDLKSSYREIDLPAFAIPIGLALEQMTNPLQLLQQEFFPKKKWRKAGLYAASLLALSLILGFALFTAGSNAVEKRKKEALHVAASTLEQWDLSLDGKTPVDQWTAAIKRYEKESPYIPSSPRAAEVLSWLSAHPLLLECRNDGDPLQLRDIHYQLIEFPRIGFPNERYQAKLEIDFFVKSPMTARKFHESLLNDSDMIDTGKGIDWEARGNGYRTSFHLKNHRVPYVP